MSMSLKNKLKIKLKQQGADFVHFVDISHLSAEQNRHYPHAVLFGIVLTPQFIQEVTDRPDYVENLIQRGCMEQDEFHCKEMQTDRMANELASWLTAKGYAACSQSEANLEATGSYVLEIKATSLPHKTIAGLAGLGWIGKHNLLVTEAFGSAISMCTVLTDAPLTTVLKSPTPSLCGDCTICMDICATNAIKGNAWNPDIEREELVDVFTCTTCLKCLAHCPWTQKYVKKHIETDLNQN